ncbi:outer dense fiber protein 2-like isoform X2 [Maniola jurtina]|uniref:outer dense fiber protein 2-like isoform X2 n=1 Tax=Maniola jurtina TaxID=191418 RepID=UPI001E68C24F|nr:outer dense fiber protein 2-like isoform X2 [Maniola jurtina]
MPKSEFWPFSSKAVEEQNVGGESSVLQKQVLLMESEMEEMRLELAAIKRERLCSSSRPPTVSQLREELIRAKNTADEERFQREKSERKLRDLETKLNGICSRGADEVKETRKTSDEVANLKKQLRSLREEMEELKTTASEKSDEVQEYRVKYLQAQQQVEELRRQIDVMELDNKQVSDQIQIEIQRMKMQFQEKLQELAPLPDLLKGAQIQLQEARQLQKLAEDSSEHLSDELNRVKEKLIAAVTNLNAEKADRKTVVEENNALKDEVDMGKKEIEELCRNIDDYKCQVLRLEEKLSQLDLRYQEKAEECARLVKDVEELREEGSRSLSRSKERAESMRRYMNTQVSELERQLIQTRAQCRTFQKERDDVRQRMQLQVNSLQENFDIAELRLRALQNQVTSLKNSYAIILSDEDEDLQKSPRLNEYLQM